MKITKYLPAALFLFALVLPGAVWADTSTYDFSGTLSSSFGGSNAVSGQFAIDFSTASISAFGFTTPFDTVDSTNYTPFVFDIAGFLGLDFQGPNPSSIELVLWFQTPTPFTTASLHLGALPGIVAIAVPLEVSGGSTANCLATLPPGPCSTVTGASTFDSGTATLVSTPEPSSLALLAIRLLVPLAVTTRRRLLPRSRAMCEVL